MRLKSALLTATLLVFPGSLVAAAADSLSGSFTVSQQTMIPGSTLQPGTYSIRVLDHLQDRYIVRVDGSGGSTHSTFIGVQDPQLKSVASTGAVPWGSAPEGNSALRGYSFGLSSPSLEFVYPKADAVALAKLNDSKVPAIDPASEGRPAELSGLSKDDMEIVSLWLLSATRVGPNDNAPAIKAEKYQQVATARPVRPVINQLPHTASELPLLLLTGLLSFAGAGALWSRRAMANRSL